VWIVPSEITKALEGLGTSLAEAAGIPKKPAGPIKRVDMGSTERIVPQDSSLSAAHDEVQKAIAAAAESSPSSKTAPPADPAPEAAADDASTPPTDEAPPAQ
jgi:hypothetical protein